MTIDELKDYMETQFGQIDGRFTGLREYVDGGFAGLREYIDERSRGIETALLRAFEKWAVRVEGAMHVHTLQIRVLEDRLSMVESRLDEIDKKGRPNA